MKASFLVFLFPFILFAHSQTPIIYGGKNNKLDSISLNQGKVVPIVLQNLNKYSQSYEISVDSLVKHKVLNLGENKIRKLNVFVKINKANTLELHKICSISIPKNKNEMFKTKICTKAYLYWVEEK